MPLLKVDDAAIFESAVILEYLEETQPNPLHPADALQRAEHRSWMEFGSTILIDQWTFYTAMDEAAFQAKAKQLTEKFARLEQRLGDGPDFDGARFSLVDAVFGPVFRDFDTFDRIADFGMLTDKPRLAIWRRALAERPSRSSGGRGGRSATAVVISAAPRFQAVGLDGQASGLTIGIGVAEAERRSTALRGAGVHDLEHFQPKWMPVRPENASGATTMKC